MKTLVFFDLFFSREKQYDRAFPYMKLAKAYDPNSYEPNIYAMWETSGEFNPKATGELPAKWQR